MSATRAPAIREARHHAPAWLITGLATAASTYALETVATTAGVALAASGLLDGFGRPLLLGVLVATYVAWAAGMRANLAANWSLLESTATSTNLLAKAAHALARASGARPRARRRATSTALRPDRAREGTALLRGSVRGRARERSDLHRRRARLPGRHKPRRRTL